MSVARKGRGKPVTVFAPGHGRAVEVTQEWVRGLGIDGTRLFFEYEHSGHFDATRGVRRQADRDAVELAAVARAGRATQAVGFSRGARAVVGALVREPGLLRRAVLVWPPMGWAAGDYSAWVGHEKLVPERTVDPGADVLVIAQQLDRDHPLKMAEQWAEALGAHLEVFSREGLLWDAHRQRFGALLGDFLSGG